MGMSGWSIEGVQNIGARGLKLSLMSFGVTYTDPAPNRLSETSHLSLACA